MNNEQLADALTAIMCEEAGIPASFLTAAREWITHNMIKGNPIAESIFAQADERNSKRIVLLESIKVLSANPKFQIEVQHVVRTYFEHKNNIPKVDKAADGIVVSGNSFQGPTMIGNNNKQKNG